MTLSKDDVLKLIEQLSRANYDPQVRGVVTLLELVVIRGLNDEFITQAQLTQYFNLAFYSRVYESLEDKKNDFLYFLATYVLSEKLILKLADRIGVDEISILLLKKWNIAREGEERVKRSRIRVDENIKNKFFEILFNDEIGERVIKRVFNQVDFEYYEKNERYEILQSLDKLTLKYERMYDLMFRLHSDLIQSQQKDPFFIIDPTVISDWSWRYLHTTNGRSRIFDFIGKDGSIRNRIEKDMESIIFNISGKSYRSSLDFDWLLNLIVEVWRSLEQFAESLESWSDESKVKLYKILCKKEEYFEDIKRIFNKDFRIEQEQKYLRRIILDEDFSALFVFLEKYKDSTDELREIVETTEASNWIWSLNGDVDELASSNPSGSAHIYRSESTSLLSRIRFTVTSTSYLSKIIRAKSSFFV